MKTAKIQIRVNASIKEKAAAKARKNDLTLTEVITNFLKNYTNER